MDGVLVDPCDAHCVAWKTMVGDEGLDFDPRSFTTLFGHASREVVAGRWGQGRYTDGDISALDDRREARYRTAP